MVHEIDFYVLFLFHLVGYFILYICSYFKEIKTPALEHNITKSLLI